MGEEMKFRSTTTEKRSNNIKKMVTEGVKVEH
jgi:hypothetical protein